MKKLLLLLLLPILSRAQTLPSVSLNVNMAPLTAGFGVKSIHSYRGDTGRVICIDSTQIATLYNITNNYLAKTGLTATTPMAFSPLTGAISIQAADATHSGYITAADWNRIGTGGGGSGTNIYNSDGTLTANRTLTNGGYSLTFSNNLTVNPQTAPSRTGQTITFLGTSITYGSVASPITNRFSTLVSAYLGMIENNLGVPGACVENRSPSSGATSMLVTMTSVPAYDINHPMVIVELGPNDFEYSSTGNNPTNYNTDLTSLFTYLHTTKNYPYSGIKATQNSYIKSTGFGITNGYGIVLTTALYNSFKAVSTSVTSSLGIQLIDVNAGFAAHGGDLLINTLDNVHPTNIGHKEEAVEIENAIAPNQQYGTTNNLTANGLVNFSNLNIANTTDVSWGSFPLAVDGSGNVGQLTGMPNSMIYNGINLSGQLLDAGIIQVGGTYTLGANDWNLQQKSIITQSNLGYTTFIPNTLGTGGSFATSYNSTGAALFTFINGAGSPAVTLYQNGNINSNGTANIGGVALPYGGVINETLGTQTNGLKLFTGTGTILYNGRSSSDGYVAIQTAPTTDNTYQDAVRFFNTDHAYFGNGGVDAGFQVDVAGQARATSIVTGSVASPTGITVTAGSSGSMPAGGKFYKLVPVDINGHLGATSIEVAASTTGTNGSVSGTFTYPFGAALVRVYEGSTSNGENQYISTTTGSFLDTGTGYTSGSPSVGNRTYLASMNSNGTITLVAYTVATLPSSPLYTEAVVTDANSPAFNTVVSGGGASTVKVLLTSAGWVAQ